LRPSTRDTPKRDGDLPIPTSSKTGKALKRPSTGKAITPHKSPPISTSLPTESFFSESFGDKNFFSGGFDNETVGSNPFFAEAGSEKAGSEEKASFDPRKYKADPGY
jgi:hypothetical protein